MTTEQTESASADGGPGHVPSVTHTTSAGSDPLIAEIRELWRQRVDLHRAEKSLTLQIKAKCRRLCDGDKKEADKLYASMLNGKAHDKAEVAFGASLPFIQARSLLEEKRKATEKQLEKLAERLPVAPWVQSVRGVGLGSLAALVGEAGDISQYSTVSKFWKRMGMAVMEDGSRQRRIGGADAIEHGYAPYRRAVVWNIGDCIIKAQSERVDKETGEVKTEAGPYRVVYDARKEYEMPRVAESTSPKAHAHNRAKRYMEKRFLRDFWRAWRDA